MKYTKADKRHNSFKLITLWRRAYLLGANKPLAVIALNIMPHVILFVPELKAMFFWPKLNKTIGIVSIVGLPRVYWIQEIKRPPPIECPGTAI